MRIFHKTESWNSKVNFVDENDRFVGFDTDQYCCEDADWFIADTPQSTTQEDAIQPEEMAGWLFDPDFFEEVNGGEFDQGGMVIFRMCKGGEEKFLHLYNCHNGYYSHGFTSGQGDVTERNECI